MRQLLPFPADDVVPYEVYRPDEGRSRFVRLNMVASVDGRATDRAGVTEGLGGPGDHELFRVLRALADGILIGAGTARIEGYGPHRVRSDLAALRAADGRGAPAPIVVVSGTLALDPASRLFIEARTRTVVVTHAAAPAERRRSLEAVAHVIVAGEREVDLAAALDELGGRFGLRHILCEGGPTLNRALLHADLVDELCLTIAPTMTGAASIPIVEPPAPAATLELRSLCSEGSELYARYRVRVGGS